MQTSTSPTRPRWTVRGAVGSDWFSVLVAAAVAVATAHLLVAEPSRVGLRVANPTDYDLTIVAGPPGGSWTAVAIVEAGTTVAVDTPDHGDVWIFRSRSQGSDGGEFQVERRQLAAADWTVTVPAGVGDRLRARGAPPSP